MTDRKVSVTIACGLLLLVMWAWNVPFAVTADRTSVSESAEPGDFVQSARLVADDGQPFSQFGSSVAVDGNTLVVGASYGPSIESVDGSAAPGAVYVYVRDGGG